MDEIDFNLRRIRTALERKRLRPSSSDKPFLPLPKPVPTNSQREPIESRYQLEEDTNSLWRYISRLLGRN